MVHPKDPHLQERPDRDLIDIHRAVLREPADPLEGRERGPWWLWTVIVLTVFGGGYYLGRYGGAFFQNVIHVGYLEPWLTTTGEPIFVLQPEVEVGEDTAMVLGERIYAANCVACHMGKGEGLPGVFPPLARSEWVIGDPRMVVKVIAHGLMGPIEVLGNPYDGIMPGWLVSLSAEEIAAVTSYIRTSFGNDVEPVSSDLVRQVLDGHPERGPWTAEELKQIVGDP